MNREELQMIITKIKAEDIDFLAEALENEKFTWNAVQYEKNYMLAEEMVKQFLVDDEIMEATGISRSTIGRIRNAFLKPLKK